MYLEADGKLPVCAMPWLRANYPTVSAIDQAVESLRMWGTVADSAIVSTVPHQQRIYTDLRARLPKLKIIPGLKAFPLFGKHGLGWLDGWEALAEHIETARRLCGDKRILLDFESVPDDSLIAGGNTALDSVHDGLERLPSGIGYIWNSRLEGHGGALSRRVKLCQLAEEVIGAQILDKVSLAAEMRRGSASHKPIAALKKACSKSPIVVIHCGEKGVIPLEDMGEAFQVVAHKWGRSTLCIPTCSSKEWISAARIASSARKLQTS